ncbi:polysaccharide biosynthesis C-terminal domain-containing protein [Companilactobacillus huachuanensis]|uniref:Polysaccharide biosynthesis C-terminal domain-containing protein n=1 Tax=Companilactobacillus huachuanensis TaxID=2559914 RepID=A0ABW1RPW5_9LACO|nr:polysaccharide biosynthesis C-terminal domain-containing protein [Companilactobacillus huachuanensis]
MRVVKNYLYNAFYQVFILIVPLITTPYLARVLGPKGVGINAYTNSIVQYFILFGSIGVSLYGNRQIAFVRDDQAKLTKTFYEIFLLRLGMILIAGLVFGVFILWTPEYKLFYLMQAVSLLAAAFDISWFFIGVENFAVTVLRSLVIRILTLISIFMFVKTANDLATYILILSLSLLFGNLLLFPSLSKYLGKISFKTLRLGRHFWPAMVLFIPQIATQIYLVLNKTMLGSMISIQSAGYFDQSDKMIKVVLAIVTATGTVMLPHVAHAFAKGDHEKTRECLYQSFSFVTALSVPMTFGLAAVTSKFVPLFFTQQFISVAPIMMIESVVILLIAWSNALGLQYLLPTKQNRAFSISVIIGAVVNLIVNIPLIMLYGAIGAAIATVISEVAVTGYQMWSVRKQISYRQLFSDIHKYLLAGILMFGVIFKLDSVLASSCFALIGEIFIGVVVYLILIVIFKVELVNKLRKRLKHAEED